MVNPNVGTNVTSSAASGPSTPASPTFLSDIAASFNSGSLQMTTTTWAILAGIAIVAILYFKE